MRSSHHTRRGRLAAVATVAALGAAASLQALATSSVVSAAAVPLSSSIAASSPAAKPVTSKSITSAAPKLVTTKTVSAKAHPARQTARPMVQHRAQAMPAAASAECAGLQSAVDLFMQHFYAAHLETSLGQQVADALAVDQYVKTHTVLIGNMLQPLLGGATSAVDTFMQHVYAAHLALSPGEQVADALAIDQYVKTHMVMVADMISPLDGADLSSC